ncbi:hypothetical protein GEZ87_10375, partial [Streptococcus mitis]|nr:hypothetical protein [Streptococcus mitis]
MDNEDNKSKQGRWAKKKERARKKTYRHTAGTRLLEMFEAGKSSKRSYDKTIDDTKNKIYSEQTYKTYKKQFGYFMDWLGQEHPEAVTIKDARKYADEFLQFRMDKGESPSTLST